MMDIKPNREPDFSLDCQDYICFWFKERIQSNGTNLFKFNPETWEYFTHRRKWISYFKLSWFRHQQNEIKNAYATWLLEKGLGL
jgi:hypothetical protein